MKLSSLPILLGVLSLLGCAGVKPEVVRAPPQAVSTTVRITVTGEVNSPGEYTVPVDCDLEEVVRRAGGRTGSSEGDYPWRIIRVGTDSMRVWPQTFRVMLDNGFRWQDADVLRLPHYMR